MNDNEVQAMFIGMTPQQLDLTRKIIALRAMRHEQQLQMKAVEKDYRASQKMISAEIDKTTRELERLTNGALPKLNAEDVPLFHTSEKPVEMAIHIEP